MKLLLPGWLLLNLIATVENWLFLQNRVVRRFLVRTEFSLSLFTMLKRRRAAIWVVVSFLLLLKRDLFYSWRQVGYKLCALTIDELFLASNDETRAVVWDKGGIFRLCWRRFVEVYIDVQSFVPGCWRRDFCRRNSFRFLSWWLKVLLFFWRYHCIRVEVDACWLLHSARLLDSDQSICLVIASGGDMDAAGRDQALEISEVLLWDMRDQLSIFKRPSFGQFSLVLH